MRRVSWVVDRGAARPVRVVRDLRIKLEAGDGGIAMSPPSARTDVIEQWGRI